MMMLMMMMMLGVSANQVGLADLCSAAAKEEFTSLSSNHHDDDKLHLQGVFLTGTPPKSSKYKKVNLG